MSLLSKYIVILSLVLSGTALALPAFAQVLTPNGQTTSQGSLSPNGQNTSGSTLTPNGQTTPGSTLTPNGQTTGGSGNCSGGGLCNPLGFSDIPGFLNAVLGVLITVGSVVIVIMIVYVGFLFVVAQGAEEKIKEARQALLWTVIGALILLGAQAISSGIQATVSALGGS